MNPNHFFAGGYKENTIDLFRKRRGHAKLSDDQVLEIYNSPKWWGSDRHFAKKFGVHKSIIPLIRNGKTYRHVTNP